jgi:DnaJ-class molecular chaperone
MVHARGMLDHNCLACGGYGALPCGPCDGTGERIETAATAGGSAQMQAGSALKPAACSDCHGAGAIRCEVCHGKGTRGQFPASNSGWARYA